MLQIEQTIHELMPTTDSISVKIHSLIEAHEKSYPEGNWSPFHDLHYDQEVAYLKRNWLPQVFREHPPSSIPIAGLWFGLFNPVIQEGTGRRETVADFYVAGAKQFVLDGSLDWAVRPAYFPEGRYANSQVLADIYRLAYGKPNGLGNDAEQFLCLGYVAFAIPELLSNFDLSLILNSEESVGVAAGWDSGDAFYFGTITTRGFEVRDPREAIAGIKKRDEEFDRLFQERFGKQSDS